MGMGLGLELGLGLGNYGLIKALYRIGFGLGFVLKGLGLVLEN